MLDVLDMVRIYEAWRVLIHRMEKNGNQDQYLGFFKSNFHFPGVLLTKVKGWCLVYIMYNILYPPNNIDYFGSREGSSIYVVLY